MYTEITTVDAALERHPEKDSLGKIIYALAEAPSKVSRGLLAFLQLVMIIYLVNNDDPNEPEFIPDYNNTEQEKWFPWYTGGDRSGSGVRFGGSDLDWTSSSTSGGARLALKDEARADHMNEHFQELYKELYLILDK